MNPYIVRRDSFPENRRKGEEPKGGSKIKGVQDPSPNSIVFAPKELNTYVKMCIIDRDELIERVQVI